MHAAEGADSVLLTHVAVVDARGAVSVLAHLRGVPNALERDGVVGRGAGDAGDVSVRWLRRDHDDGAVARRARRGDHGGGV